MKKIIFSILILSIPIFALGQLFESKSELFGGYTNGNYLGSPLFNDQGTIAPSFYSNLQSLRGISIGYSYKLSKNYSVVFSVNQTGYALWASKEYISYKDVQLRSTHFCPAFQFQTAFAETGLYNRFELYGNLSPVLTISSVTYPFKEDYQIYKVIIKEASYGVRFTIGAKYALSNQMGIFFNTSLQQSFLKSQLYIDSSYLLNTINIGIYYSISKPKSFNY